MCLAVPGRILTIKEDPDTQSRIGQVDFQGSSMEVDLTLVPDAKEDAWVLVHAGYAIQLLSESEAREVWDMLAAVEEAQDSNIPS